MNIGFIIIAQDPSKKACAVCTSHERGGLNAPCPLHGKADATSDTIREYIYIQS